MKKEQIQKIFTSAKLIDKGPKEAQGLVSLVSSTCSQVTNAQVLLFDKKCLIFMISGEAYSLKVKAKIQPKMLMKQEKTLEIDFVLLHYENSTIQLQSKDKSLLLVVYKKLKAMHSHKGFQDYFKPLKRLGKGSFAAVYLIEHRYTGERFAAKVFSREGQKIQYKGRECLQNQIKMIQTLDNPHIIRYEGLYQTDNLIYVVTQYLSGGTLIQFLRSNRSSLDLHLAKIITDILQALAYLKSQHIMHRDIKPENIVLRKQTNTWVLVDFGLAAFTDQNYLYNKCGTMGYIAPEIMAQQDKPQKYDQSCDLYSFGVVCYEMIVGCLPFNVEVENYYNRKYIWYGITKEECKELDPQIVRFLKGLLEFQPKKRWTPQICLQSEVLKSKQVIQNWKKYADKMRKEQYEKVFKPRNQ